MFRLKLADYTIEDIAATTGLTVGRVRAVSACIKRTVKACIEEEVNA